MEETLINLYLSGYSNNEVNAESSLVNAHTNGQYVFILYPLMSKGAELYTISLMNLNYQRKTELKQLGTN